MLKKNKDKKINLIACHKNKSVTFRSQLHFLWDPQAPQLVLGMMSDESSSALCGATRGKKRWKQAFLTPTPSPNWDDLLAFFARGEKKKKERDITFIRAGFLSICYVIRTLFAKHYIKHLFANEERRKKERGLLGWMCCLHTLTDWRRKGKIR